MCSLMIGVALERKAEDMEGARVFRWCRRRASVLNVNMPSGVKPTLKASKREEEGMSGQSQGEARRHDESADQLSPMLSPRSKSLPNMTCKKEGGKQGKVSFGRLREGLTKPRACRHSPISDTRIIGLRELMRTEKYGRGEDSRRQMVSHADGDGPDEA
jgi:hypothetical protein